MPDTVSGGGGNVGGNGPGIKTEPMGFVVPGVSVTNGSLVPFNNIMFERLTPKQVKAVKVSMLTYSRDVSTRLAQAYTEILAIIDV
jgi:hypothetical protein